MLRFLKQGRGRGLSPLPQGENNDAQVFAQTRTLRIRQRHGFDFSSEFSTLPLRATAILAPIFMRFRGPAGPTGQRRKSAQPTSFRRAQLVPNRLAYKIPEMVPPGREGQFSIRVSPFHPTPCLWMSWTIAAFSSSSVRA